MAYYHIHYELSSYFVDADDYIEAADRVEAEAAAQSGLHQFVSGYEYLFEDGREPEEIEADEDLDLDALAWEDASYDIEEIDEAEYNERIAEYNSF